MPQSSGLRRPRALCRSQVDSTECCCPVDSVERLWLAVSDSNGERPKTAPGLTWYSGAEAAAEARVESSKMTENSAEKNASSSDATGAAASSEEGGGWMRSTKVANLTVELNKKTEKGAEQNASSCAATREAACNGKGAGWQVSTRLFLCYFFQSSAENSHKIPPYWGIGVCIFFNHPKKTAI